MIVHAWGEVGCVHMDGVEWHALGEGDVYMEGCVHIWKGWSMHAWGEVECVCIWKGLNAMHGEREMCIWKGWSVCTW